MDTHVDANIDSDEDDNLFDDIASLAIQGDIPGFGTDNSSDDSDDELPAVARARNKARNFEGSYQRFHRYYFAENPVFNEQDFERRFRMPKRLFERIDAALRGRSIFKHREDATGKKGIHPQIRLVAALRILAYGMSFDQTDELCELGGTTSRESFLAFVQEINAVFGDEYLRAPRESDLRRILAINDARGFPGCVGSWDCQHWVWQNCPVAWAGQFKGKEKKPTVVLEAIADGELWIWGCNFGEPGSMNDLNVLDASKIVKDILEGKMLPEFSYTVNGTTRKLCYYLVDGIYPKWSIFIDTISEAMTRKEKHFSAAQEGLRKDVERAFGVLVSRWHILRYPCLFWDKSIMVKTIYACIILHNMIVECRRDGYASQLFEHAREAADSGMFVDENGNEKPFVWRTRSSGNNELGHIAWTHRLHAREQEITDEVGHFSLKRDLVEHVWNNWGCK